MLQKAGIQVTKDYRDDAFKIFDVMLSTVDSCAKHLDRDVLIIDEVFSVWEELGMKTQSNPSGNSESLLHTKYNAIQAHKHIFILDRYINPVIKLFDAFQGNDFQMIHNIYKKPKEIVVHKCKNIRYYNEEILNKIDTRKGRYLLQGSIISPLVKFSASLSDLGIDSMLKTSKHNKEMSNENFDKHNIKISSPIISKGVSLSADYVYILDSGTSVGVIGILQMADRARNSTTINIRTLKGNLGKVQEIQSTFKQITQLGSNIYNKRILEFLEDSRKREEYHDLMVLYCLSDTYDLI